MPHISLPEGLPGITGGFAFRPETAKPMRELAHTLLHGPSTLTPGERELIATYVSTQNDCYFCQTSHGAAAAAHLGKNSDVVEQVKSDFLHARVSEKLKALLLIAGQCNRAARLFLLKLWRRRVGRVQLILRSTIPSSSLPPSACITATSMVLRRGNLVIQRCIPAW